MSCCLCAKTQWCQLCLMCKQKAENRDLLCQLRELTPASAEWHVFLLISEKKKIKGHPVLRVFCDYRNSSQQSKTYPLLLINSGRVSGTFRPLGVLVFPTTPLQDGAGGGRPGGLAVSAAPPCPPTRGGWSRCEAEGARCRRCADPPASADRGVLTPGRWWRPGWVGVGGRGRSQFRRWDGELHMLLTWWGTELMKLRFRYSFFFAK